MTARTLRKAGRRVTTCVSALVLLGAAAACAGKHDTAGKSAALLSTTASSACTKGADEGTFNYWTSTDTDVFQKEIVPFEKANPKIKVHYTSLEPVNQVQRIITETQAHHKLDVDAIAGDLPSFDPLLTQKLIQPIDWSKLGIPKDLQFTLDGYTMVRTYREVLGLGYNTKLVNPADLPSTWQGLIESKWAHHVIVDPRGIYLSGLALGMGQDKALTWFKDLLKTDKPLIIQGATASMEKVISGEAKLTTSSHDSEAAEQQANGAPVGIKYLDIVPTQDWYALVMKGAEHPNAAACFFSWWLGSEGQAQQAKYEFKSDETKPAGIPAGAKLVAIDSPAQAKLATSVATQFSKLMTNG
jgi:iron(III) transport system substrate-binding protein